MSGDQDLAPTVQLILALRRLNSGFVSTNRAVCSALGIKEGDLAVLDLLHQEGPQTPSVLARRTRMHVATMTGVLGRLERDGWIDRAPNSADRRSVSIQAAAVTRLSDIYAHTNERLGTLVQDWRPEQVEAMTELLNKVVAVGEQLTTELDHLTHSATT